MATIPTFITFVAGSVLTAAQLNAGVRDAGNFWLNVKPALDCRQTVTQSVATGTWTSILMDTEDYDNDNMHSTSSNTSRATVVTPGRYLFVGNLDFATNGTGFRGAKLLKNGTTSYAKAGQYPASSGTDMSFVTSRPIFMAAGDFMELQGWHSVGSALSTASGDGQPSLQAIWLASA